MKPSEVAKELAEIEDRHVVGGPVAEADFKRLLQLVKSADTFISMQDSEITALHSKLAKSPITNPLPSPEAIADTLLTRWRYNERLYIQDEIAAAIREDRKRSLLAVRRDFGAEVRDGK